MGKHEPGTSPAVSRPAQEARITELEQRVDELGRRLELATTAEAILARAGAPPARPVPRSHAKPRQLPRGWRILPGGMAALAPVAFAAHGGAAPVVATAARVVWRSHGAQLTAAALLFGLAGASWGGTVAYDGDHPARCSRACAEARQDHAQAAESLRWHPMPRSQAVGGSLQG